MPNYRRATVAGACYFFTVVTANRQPIFNAERVALLRETVREIKREKPFAIDAWVVLPDHLHAIWRMPTDDADYSTRWGLIKSRFSRRSGLSTAGGRRRDAQVWQPRFWEHQIRDEKDWRTHMDYLHFNPVKHGLVPRVQDWQHSSFHRLVAAGIYPSDWGVGTDPLDSRQFGE